jgi:Uma2 family endonuclease
MIAQTETKKYTLDEYLELEVVSEERSEYRNGEIMLMKGRTPNHNDITGNLYILLKSALKGKDYRTFYVDQRLWIPAVSLYTYPDVMVLSKPLQLQTGRKDTVMNPCSIAEVLSKRNVSARDNAPIVVNTYSRIIPRFSKAKGYSTGVPISLPFGK